MALVKRNGNQLTTFPVLFDDFFNRDLFDWGLSNFSSTGTIPAVNIKETPEAFQVEMAAPGMDKKDFKVKLEGNRLIIRSEKNNQPVEKEDGKYTCKEFSYQTFQRTFDLPKEEVDADKIKAKYEDGILNLLIPKKEEAKQKQPKLIQVS